MFNNTWVKNEPQVPKFHKQSKISKTVEMEDDDDEEPEGDQEFEEEEEEDEVYEPVNKKPAEQSVRLPFSETASLAHSAQPKNLRNLLNKIKRDKPAQLKPIEEEKHKLESSEDDQGNNSDTFGDPKRSIFPRKRGSRVIGTNQPKIDLDDNSSIQEIPKAISEASDESDDNDIAEAPIIVPIKINQALNKKSNKNSFEEIKTVIARCKAEKSQGKTSRLETPKAKLLKM